MALGLKKTNSMPQNIQSKMTGLLNTQQIFQMASVYLISLITI